MRKRLTLKPYLGKCVEIANVEVKSIGKGEERTGHGETR
jgi:hypothetical protein